MGQMLVVTLREGIEMFPIVAIAAAGLLAAGWVRYGHRVNLALFFLALVAQRN